MVEDEIEDEITEMIVAQQNKLYCSNCNWIRTSLYYMQSVRGVCAYNVWVGLLMVTQPISCYI